MVEQQQQQQQRPISPPLPPEPTDASNSAFIPPGQRLSADFSPTQAPQATQLPPPPGKDSTLSSTSRSRTTASRAPPVLPQQQQQQLPIKDAVNTAFDQSATTSQLDPELVRQVTEQVIKNLQAASFASPTSTAPQAPSSNYSTSPQQTSPLRSSVDSFPPRFTPPSPRISRHAGRDRYVSPERAPTDTGSWDSHESTESRKSTQSNLETTPRGSHVETLHGLKRSKTIAADGTVPLTEEAQSRRSSGDSKSFRKDSKDSDSGYFESPRNRAQATDEDVEETTTLEKIWQPLFDNGNPTVRLSQFLRGLAKHIIDDYEPKKTLVIPPMKMLRFFDETKVAEEYPWSTIFGGKMSFSSVSTMYRQLTCEHHFIQQRAQEAPLVPALTPEGFATFLTCLIQAHPDTEFERLAKAVREMPISNADDTKERFPKELSRRLFPSKANVQAEQRLIASLSHEPVLIRLERGTSAMPPPPPGSGLPKETSFVERERNPYSQTNQSSNAVDDEDLTPPSMPIERERQPYYAREGTGKRYDTDADRERERERERDRDERDSAQQSRDPSRAAKYRPPEYANGSRNQSGVPPQSMYNTGTPTDPMNIPNRRGRISTGPPPPPPTSGSFGKSSSRRSPPRGSFARSEPMDINNIPQSQYASNLHGSTRDRYPSEMDEDTLRYSRRPERSSTFVNEDDFNGRSAASRNSHPSGFSGRSSGQAPTGPDQRRQSWYTGMGPGGGPGAGTDGYGSYAPPPGGVYGSSGQY